MRSPRAHFLPGSGASVDISPSAARDTGDLPDPLRAAPASKLKQDILPLLTVNRIGSIGKLAITAAIFFWQRNPPEFFIYGLTWCLGFSRGFASKFYLNGCSFFPFFSFPAGVYGLSCLSIISIPVSDVLVASMMLAWNCYSYLIMHAWSCYPYLMWHV